MTNWEQIRKDFPVCNNLAYFQNAGMSPIPTPVFEAITQAWDKIHHYGDIDWMGDMQKVEQMKAHLSGLIHSTADNLSFVHNSSLALNLVALAMKQKFQQGFNIVTMEHEFPSSNVPFASQGIEVRYVKAREARFLLSDIEACMDSNTKAIVTSWVQYATGFRQNLEALGQLAKEKGVLFIVNATQGLPMFQMDVNRMHIDVMTASLHKWGCCGHVGAAFYTSPDYRRNFPAPLSGWLSVLPPDNDFIPTQKNVPFVQYSGAAQYNLGTTNFQNLLGLKASLEYMERIGFENIRNRIMELSSELISKLKTLPLTIISPIENENERSGILSVSLHKDFNAQAVQFLEQHKISTSLRMGNIRIAPSFFNNQDDIHVLIEKLAEFTRK